MAFIIHIKHHWVAWKPKIIIFGPFWQANTKLGR